MDKPKRRWALRSGTGGTVKTKSGPVLVKPSSDDIQFGKDIDEARKSSLKAQKLGKDLVPLKKLQLMQKGLLKNKKDMDKLKIQKFGT